MGIELRYTCLNCKPSQSTRLPPGVSGTSRTSGNLASDRPDWVVFHRTASAIGHWIPLVALDRGEAEVRAGVVSVESGHRSAQVALIRTEVEQE